MAQLLFDQSAKQNLTTTNFLNLGTLKRWQTQATLSLVVTDGRTLEPSLWYSYFLNRKPQTNYISFLHSFLMCHKGYAIFQLAFLENLYLIQITIFYD